MSRRVLVLLFSSVALVGVILGLRAILAHDANAKEQQQPAAAATPAKGSEAPSGAPARGAAGPGGPTVQVIAAKAENKDVPIWLEGLGTVTAWQNVTVKPQVDGVLQSVLFKEGQPVKAGDVLAEIDPRPFVVQLHQAEGALSRDQSAVTNGKLNLERYKVLVQQKLIAQQQVTDQEAVVAQAEGSIKVDQAAVEAAKLNLDYAKIKSPCNGIAGVRLVDAGNQIHATDANGLVVITQVDPSAVIVTLPQDNLPAVQAALARGQVPVEAWSRDGAQKLGEGTLYAVDNQINVATGTVRLKAQIPNPNHALWPNAFVKGRLLVDVAKNALVVPAQAIQRGPQGTYVYVAQEDGTAVQKPVQVKLTTADLAILGGGVEAGQQVILEGQNQLRPGAKVAVRPAK
jgi:membrane fusion protein, multidrug efflux system